MVQTVGRSVMMFVREMATRVLSECACSRAEFIDTCSVFVVAMLCMQPWLWAFGLLWGTLCATKGGQVGHLADFCIDHLDSVWGPWFMHCSSLHLE